MSSDFRAGDIVLTTHDKRGVCLLSRLIAWASRMPGECRTRATHAAIVVTPGTLQSATILEALWPRAVISPLGKYSSCMIVYRPVHLKSDLIEQMAAMARRHAELSGSRKRGVLYGLIKLPLFLLDSLLSKALCRLWMLVCLLPGLHYAPFEVRFFTRLNLVWSFVCSQVVARVYGEIAGVDFGRHWTRVNPDDIDDYCTAHPAEFEQLHHGSLLQRGE